MGNQQSTQEKQYIKPKQRDQKQQNKMPNENLKRVIQYLNDYFKRSSVNGKLNKDKFNQSLAILQVFNYKRLKDTPLSERLFQIFDTDKSNSVSQRQFKQGLTKIFNDKQYRIQGTMLQLVTYKAYDKNNDFKISKKEFMEFLSQSWKAGYRSLGEKINTQHPELGIKVTILNAWAHTNLKHLNNAANRIFTSIDRYQQGFIQYNQFKQWTKNSGFDIIVANYQQFKIQIPISLCNMFQH